MTDIRGLDTVCDITAAAPALKAAGYAWVGRYGCTHTEIPGKMLTLAEAQAINDAGLQLVSIWENGSPTIPNYFTRDQGHADGTAAQAFFAALGQPSQTPIYFAVDGDVPWEPVEEYLVGVIFGLTSYRAAVYGSGLICSEASEMNLVSHAWLAQATRWSGYKEFLPKATIVQGKWWVMGLQDSSAPHGAWTIGHDEDTAQAENYGQWQLPISAAGA